MSACRLVLIGAFILYSAIINSSLLAQELQIPEELQRAEESRIAAIERASAAAVGVFGPGGQGGGSGVVITPDGYTLTNFHVVQGNGPFMQCSMPDGVLYEAVIVGIDPVGDVAIIKLLGRDDFPVAEIANSDEVKQGDWCFAVGNPFLLATNFQPTVTWGIVSGTHRYQYPAGTLLEYADCIQTDAAINPGNSGGPLFNAAGQLIGINGRGSFEKRGRVNVGVGYAISINQINYFLHHLLSGRLVDHATLGATVATNERGEVRVSNILESSDAYRRGLRFDDQIVSFAGRDIQTVNQFKNVLGIFPKGWRAPLSFLRDGQRTDITVRLTGVHATEELQELVNGAEKPATERPIPNPGGQPDQNDSNEQDDAQPQPGKDSAEDGEPADGNDRDQENAPSQRNQPNPPSPDEQDQSVKGPGTEKKTNPNQHLYQAKPGFVNYYFNQLNRDRVWDAFRTQGDFSKQPENWRITAVDGDGAELKIVLGDQQSGLQYRGEAQLIERGQELAAQVNPNDTSAMLLSLHLWRKLLIKGPSGFGQTNYFGRLPLTDKTGLMDVLDASHEVIEVTAFFDPANGELSSFEMSPDVAIDPCVLQFSAYQRHGDLFVPLKMRVRMNNQSDRIFELKQIEFVEPDSSTAEGPNVQ